MIFLVYRKLLPIHYLKVKKGFNAKKSGVTKLVCEINWIKCKISAFLYVTVVIATDVTLYLLTVLEVLKVMQCITLVSFFSEISIGSF